MSSKVLDESRSFLGVGWAFPVEIAPDGAIQEVAYDDDIQQAIRIILGTNPGERVMRPDFGAGLNTFVFEPVNATTMAKMQERVQEALVAWEPRVDVLSVEVSGDTQEGNKLLIDVTYRVRATNTRANLVYPFYLDEGSTP